MLGEGERGANVEGGERGANVGGGERGANVGGGERGANVEGGERGANVGREEPMLGGGERGANVGGGENKIKSLRTTLFCYTASGWKTGKRPKDKSQYSRKSLIQTCWYQGVFRQLKCDIMLVSCPACALLPARNGLVNKVGFLGLIYSSACVGSHLSKHVGTRGCLDNWIIEV